MPNPFAMGTANWLLIFLLLPLASLRAEVPSEPPPDPMLLFSPDQRGHRIVPIDELPAEAQGYYRRTLAARRRVTQDIDGKALPQAYWDLGVSANDGPLKWANAYVALFEKAAASDAKGSPHLPTTPPGASAGQSMFSFRLIDVSGSPLASVLLLGTRGEGWDGEPLQSISLRVFKRKDGVLFLLREHYFSENAEGSFTVQELMNANVNGDPAQLVRTLSQEGALSWLLGWWPKDRAVDLEVICPKAVTCLAPKEVVDIARAMRVPK